MINYVIFIIGFILIGFSIIVIIKDLNKSEINIDEMNKIEENVKEYYKLTEEMIESFDDLIVSKIEEINTDTNFKKMNENDKEEKVILNNEDNNKNMKVEDNIIEKILELKSIGLNIEEIAKMLNKGVREIEIIMKMHISKNMDKNI
ncbi:MAG: hypothetical protein GX300_01265 [Tissierellia bacterium]|nr:hypothetical protein [Tissierellia bacterium]